MNDVFWHRAIELAKKGEGLTSPNPCVGAVLVKGGEIVSEGWHRKAGGPHAEVFAFEEFEGDCSDCELYVTLEPCAHVGKTGSCADLIVSKGVKKVFVGMRDPFSEVDGKGVQKLIDAGIEVEYLDQSSALYREIRLLNQPFIKSVVERRPFVVLKSAVSLDGKIATKSGDSKWITSEEARIDAKKFRSFCDCVLVGAGTVAADDCELASSNGREIFRVIIDPELSLDTSLKVFRDENVFVACTERADQGARERFEAAGVRFADFGSERVGLDKLLEYLLEEFSLQSVFVEGGAKVHGSFLRAGLVDAVLVYIAPKLIGADGLTGFGFENVKALDEAFGVEDFSVDKVGGDVRLKGLVNFY